ncbi:hypothetical protein ACIQCM_12560 [Pseudarthrobacter sp. NPDC092439]|uniref:hypothetical protein n=1 Tax=unclassified Pseudarthrobacter TaxID=2647000 RepID=UPI00381C192E
MKKSDRIARDLELSVTHAVENAREWATPRVEAAVDWAVPRLQQGIDTASPKIQEGLKTAAHNLADGVATVTPRIQDGLAHLAPKINDAVEGASPRLHEALDKATPVILNARDRVVVEYLPRLSDQIGQASTVVHRTLENTPAHVDAVAQKLGDVGLIHALQEQAQAAGTQLKAAAAEAGRAANLQLAEPAKPKKRGWLVFGVIAAAVAAGVAAWKASKPVEDPWKTPSPVKPTPAPVPATTVSEVKDNTPAAAVDTAGTAAAAPSAAATGTAAAGDKEGTRKEDTDKEAGEKAKHVAEDAAGAPTAATDAKTATKNIAANIGDKGNKSSTQA